MGASSSQKGFQTGSHTCSKQPISEQSPELGAREPAEREDQLHSETALNVAGETSNALSSHITNKDLCPFSEHMVYSSSNEYSGMPPEDGSGSQANVIACLQQTVLEQTKMIDECAHGEALVRSFQPGSESVQSEPGTSAEVSRPYADCESNMPSWKNIQLDTEINQHKSGETSTSKSSGNFNRNSEYFHENATTDAFSEYMVSPTKDISKMSQNGRCSCPEQTLSGQAIEFGCSSMPCEPAEENALGSGVAHPKPLQTTNVISSYIATKRLGSSPELVTKTSAVEPVRMPPGNVNKIPNLETLGPVPKNLSRIPCLKELESSPKNIVQNAGSLAPRYRKTVKSSKRKGLLRASRISDRVLRPRSQEKPKAPELRNYNGSRGEEKLKKKKTKKRTRGKGTKADEYSRIRSHLRYLLNRVNYEQSLIDAYSAEGWKGLSLEKLKPEKELQRAKSEILRRKLKIRDLFQRLDSLCAEGRFPESLFDSEGQIDSEDIFCAKCGSKDLSANDDIILCDGACDRGFHLFCLEPPLLKEDIPSDDDGWLCPGCDCKVDCIDLLNDSQGTNLSINDNWQKVFPEAAVAAAAGQNQNHALDLPSDDSDDDDYDPDHPGNEEKDGEDESGSSQSDFTSASEELEVPPNDDLYLGLPSDDSEDDDYNPDALDPQEKVKEESSSSEFTSDSEDLSATFDDDTASGKTESKLGGKKRQSINSELLVLESDPGQGGSSPVSVKRNVERLDYKKLHDETYGKVPSDSSDDEDWSDTVSSIKKGKKGEIAAQSQNGSTPVIRGRTSGRVLKQDRKENENTPGSRSQQKLKFEDSNTSPVKLHGGPAVSVSSGKRVRSAAYKKLDEAVTQGLYKSFKENQYPDRATKENLAKELGITFKQVSKWFENARWSFNHPSTKYASTSKSASKRDTSMNQTDNRLIDQKVEKLTKGANTNVAQSGEPSKIGKSATKCSYKDVRDGGTVTKRVRGQKSTDLSPKRRKRKGKFNNQASGRELKIEEAKPEAREAQTTSGIQTRRRRSIA